MADVKIRLMIEKVGQNELTDTSTELKAVAASARPAENELKSLEKAATLTAKGFDAAGKQAAQWNQTLRDMAKQEMLASKASSDLIAGMSKAGRAAKENSQNTEELNKSWIKSEGGLNKASNAINNLAGNLLGVNNGIANAAEGLITAFGGGGAAAVAGIGIVGLTVLWRALTKEEREAKEAYDAWLESLRVQTPIAIAGRNLDVQKLKLAEMKDRLASIAANTGDATLTSSENKELNDQVKLVEELQKQYDQLFASLRSNSRMSADEAKSQALALFEANVQITKKAFDSGRAQKQDWADLNQEIKVYGQLIRDAKTDLDRLRLKEALKDLMALRDSLTIPLGRNEGVRGFNTGGAGGTSLQFGTDAKGRRTSFMSFGSDGADLTNFMGVSGASAAEQQAAIAQANRAGLSDAMKGVGGESSPGANPLSKFEEAAKPFREFRIEAIDLHKVLKDLSGDTLVSLTDGFVSMFETVGKGKNVFEGLAKAALKPVADEARGYGRLAIGKGLIKIKEGLWPPNPLAILSGAGMIAAGGGLLALVGQVMGGGGSGGGGGGGGQSSSVGTGLDTRAQKLADLGGELTVFWPRGVFANPDDPKFQDLFAKTMDRGRRAKRIRIQVY